MDKIGDKDLEYYSKLDTIDVLKDIGSSEQGLTSNEAYSRLKAFGHNLLEERKKTATIIEFLKHFRSPLIIILILAAGVSVLFGQIIDSIIISIMILLSVMLDFFQEHHAGKAAEKLKESVKTIVHVQRDGREMEINIEDVVPGDIIILNAGNIVPGDARIIASKDFFVNQSSLTGESFPCEKTNAQLRTQSNIARISLTDMDNMVFMGTNVISGSASAIVIKTGKSSEFGKISVKLVAKENNTEFEKGMTSFSYLILKATIFLVIFIFMFNALMRKDIFQSLLFAIAIAVGLTPELLPMIMSVDMAKCSISMAKKGVIVKKLSSIPNFGGMDVLCTDKTGTLTEDRIQLVKHIGINGKDSEDVLVYSYLNSFYQTGIQNPLDQALIDFRKLDVSGYTKIDEIPFDFIRKKMSVIVEKSIHRRKLSFKRVLITKGAPEEIFKSCSTYMNGMKQSSLDLRSRKKVTDQYHELSKQGYRVLAVGIKELKGKSSAKEVYDKEDESDMILIGFIAFLDPPKSDAKEIIEELHGMGVEVKILTGDNEFVTEKICRDIDLRIKGVVLGTEINNLNDDALRVIVENNTVFARVSPDQKNRIITALQANNHVVGYLGDGINDAPSLKNADVGISVSKAVDVAKESAVIVLTHKSLHVLKEGVIDGRKTFGNTMKYIMMTLSSNFGNMFSVAGAVIFLPFLPMLPLQILLNNFMYDISQVTIPTDNVDATFIDKPKRWNMKFIKRFMIVFGLISSLFDFLTFIIMYFIFHVPAPLFQTAWFMESLATQALVIHVIRTKNSPFKSRASNALLISSLLCVAVGWIIPYIFIGKYFGFVALPFNMLLVIIGLLGAYLVMVEVIKRIFYRTNVF